MFKRTIFGLILILISGCCGGSAPRPATSPSPFPEPVAAPPSVEVEAPPVWEYRQNSDPMGKGDEYLAYILSTNTVNFSFPYAGEQHARLALRTHPRFGKDVIFSIERGQLLCPSYEDCNVLVRFDDEPPSNYSAVGSADNSTETIFIRNYKRFVGKLLKAKKVRISVNVYQQGAPVFEFDLGSFDPNKYRPKA
jgi:hypothetical protein